LAGALEWVQANSSALVSIEEYDCADIAPAQALVALVH